MYVNMVTRPVYKNKEVSTLPNNMKHISPLQRSISSPNMQNLKKKETTYSPQEARKFHPKDIKMNKDDQGGTRNPYKCMNVMKQDAMNDKIIERCKTCEKQISQ